MAIYEPILSLLGGLVTGLDGQWMVIPSLSHTHQIGWPYPSDSTMCTSNRKLVAATTHYFPSLFHCPPRNPAKKISSGYKATEYYLYLFGLGPALFWIVLSKKYWKHFYKLIHGVWIIIQ